MSDRFIASPPADQSATTYRQFVELQRYLEQLETRIAPETISGRLIIDPITDPVVWQPVALDPDPVLGPGTWQVSSSVEITGVGGAGFIQFRINGVDGRTWTANANTDRQISTTFFVEGPTTLTVDVRGDQVDENDGVFHITRVGAQP